MRQITDICYGEAPLQKLDLYLPPQPEFKTLLWFHGGGLENGTKDTGPLAPYCAAHGVAFASADYRLYPFARYPDFILDAARAAAYVKNHISDYGRSQGLFIGGSSAGAYLSMMLMLDARWLAPYHMTPEEIAGFIHNAGQPTTHYNVLRERGLDPRRVMADEAAPVYHVGLRDASLLPPMQVILSDHDMPGRLEQNQLLIAAMKRFGYPEKRLSLTIMRGTTHCSYDRLPDADGSSALGALVCGFMERAAEMK